MLNRIKSFSYFFTFLVLVLTAGCKKGTFDINDVNPNVPSSVSPKFILSAALKTSASINLAGDQDFAQLYMGYWAVSGDYIPSATTLTYQTTTDYFQDNWNSGYIVLQNYRQIETLSAGDANAGYFKAIAKIMESYHLGRLVDMYNNIPYSDALDGGTENFPKYDDAKSVYTAIVKQLDTAITLIKSAPATATSPSSYDIMFGGNMTYWTLFANTVKLKILMNLTQKSDQTAFITSELSGLTTASFLGASQDAVINPGYSNSSSGQQSPFWQDMGYTTSGAFQGNHAYYRACSYAANFLLNNYDTLRASLIYAPNTTSGVVKGRAFGSTAANGEDNEHISAVGTGLLKSASMGAVMLPATESFFLQAEAALKGYISGSASSFYQSAVSESFRLLGVSSPATAAATFTSQASNANVNYTYSSNKLQTIILQEWVALNGIDAVQTWSNWRRLGIPSDLPVSIYPGTTATHVPYRLLYPTTEYSYNSTNVSAQGTISNMTSKVFWMP